VGRPRRSRQGELVLVAWIVTSVLHESFVGYQGLEERLWALVAQAWALVCATVLILEATLEPGVLRAHEASMRRHGLGEMPERGRDLRHRWS
jgi:hypothetical protein